MLQALPVKLENSDDEKALLLATMRKYNEAANFLAELAFRLKIANRVTKEVLSSTARTVQLICTVCHPCDKQSG